MPPPTLPYLTPNHSLSFIPKLCPYPDPDPTPYPQLRVPDSHKVDHVVHYDAARSAEVFIHRAGRTARARAAGLSLSIVAPRDDANHRQTCKVLGLHDGMKAFPQEVRLVERARERVGMALRVRERETGVGGGAGREGGPERCGLGLVRGQSMSRSPLKMRRHRNDSCFREH